MTERIVRRRRRGPWWLTSYSRGPAIFFTVLNGTLATFWFVYCLADFSPLRLGLGLFLEALTAAGAATIVYLTRHRPAPDSDASDTEPAP